MGVATETYEELCAALLHALDEHDEGGPEPIGWTVTSEMYRQLDYPGEPFEHFKAADAAIYSGELKPLYGLPVSIETGAHHAWSLRTDRDAASPTKLLRPPALPDPSRN